MKQLPQSLLLPLSEPDTLRIALAEFKTPDTDAEQQFTAKSDKDRSQDKKIASIATTIWRMSKRAQEKAEYTPEHNHLISKINHDTQSLLEDLEVMGVTIWDKTGQHFDYGMPEKVIDVKPQIGISKEHILETIRPTVTWKDGEKVRIIQVGEVIIQAPAQASTT